MRGLPPDGEVWPTLRTIDKARVNVSNPSTLDALPVADLAKRWTCSTSTVRRKIQRGLLPVVLLPGSNRPLIPQSAIEAAEQPRPATAPATA